jgi:DNA (cytosine-5)-methyltransferase 1
VRFAELFAGAGGLSLGLERAGHECVWHAEWADAPRQVLKHHWPDVPLYGNVTALDGRALVAMHGPIDLLSGGSPCQDLSVAGKRAGLEGSRSSLFFQQMRLWDEAGADLCLWENVDGARSSNNGKDFAEVLRAFVGAAIAVPSGGWRSAGVAAGPQGIAAWRVLDAQFFGVPQRRRRVFVLGTRTGSVDPAEILSLAEGVRGDPSTRREAGEGAAGRAGVGAPITFKERGRGDGYNLEWRQDGTTNALLLPNGGRGGVGAADGVLAFSPLQGGRSMPVGTPIVARMVAFGEYVEDGTASAIKAPDWKDATDLVVAGTLESRPTAGGFPGTDGATSGHVVPTHGIPRRLMPIECERLMGWPDNHTLVPDAKGKLLSDAARYRAIGNGVASHVAQWIGERLNIVNTPGRRRSTSLPSDERGE